MKELYVEFIGTADGDAAGFNLENELKRHPKIAKLPWFDDVDTSLRLWEYVQPEDYFTADEKAKIGRWIDENSTDHSRYESAEKYFSDLEGAPADDDWADYFEYAIGENDPNNDWWIEIGAEIAERHAGEEWRDLKAMVIEAAEQAGIPADALDFSGYDDLLCGDRV